MDVSGGEEAETVYLFEYGRMLLETGRAQKMHRCVPWPLGKTSERRLRCTKALSTSETSKALAAASNRQCEAYFRRGQAYLELRSLDEAAFSNAQSRS